MKILLKCLRQRFLLAAAAASLCACANTLPEPSGFEFPINPQQMQTESGHAEN